MTIPAIPDSGTAARPAGRTLEIFTLFLQLGCTSFGGPVAHLARFRQECVERRHWLSDAEYADLIALCQFLPGPASSQTGIALGWLRGGLGGACLAWLGFTAPSALLMLAFAWLVHARPALADGQWLHGLAVVTVPVIVQALWGMGRVLCPDRERASIAVVAAGLVACWPSAITQVAVIIAGGLAGSLLSARTQREAGSGLALPMARRYSLLLLIYAGLLVALPWIAHWQGGHAWQLISRFYHAGALIFGGGHVVLGLLQSEVVPNGWISNELFLAGYGVAQALPGPITTFAVYLGALAAPTPNGWLGGGLALTAIFLPSFLLVLGALPWWGRLRGSVGMQRSLAGINASVVGLLLAAFYHPVWTSGIRSSQDFAMALVALLLLVSWKWPPWLVVLLCALAGAALANGT